jgi:hypothetical protein
VTGPSSDWFPTPPPKPLQAASTAKLALGALLVVLLIAGAAVALSTVGHSSPAATTTPPAVPTAPVPATPTAASRRAAFEDCLKGMGAGSAPGVGRFGRGGPSQSFRDAYDVCRSLLQSGALDPVAPGSSGTLTAPAA